MTKECKFCGKEFETIYTYQKYCSRKCALSDYKILQKSKYLKQREIEKAEVDEREQRRRRFLAKCESARIRYANNFKTITLRENFKKEFPGECDGECSDCTVCLCVFAKEQLYRRKLKLKRIRENFKKDYPDKCDGECESCLCQKCIEAKKEIET